MEAQSEPSVSASDSNPFHYTPDNSSALASHHTLGSDTIASPVYTPPANVVPTI